MTEALFQECIKRQNENDGKPFWNELANNYGYKSGEALRCAVKNEKKRRGYFDLDSSNYQSESDSEKTSYTENHDNIQIVVSSKRLKNQQDIIKHFSIDTDIWEVDSYTVKTSEGYRKDRVVEWDVEDGTVKKGHVRDSGKMLVVPLYHIQIKLVKKQREAKAKDAVSLMIADAKQFSPEYPKIEYPKHKDGCLYEIGIPDIHFGRLAWAEETGDDLDINIAEKSVMSAMNQLITSAKQYNISKILLPIGNDFFNSDNNMSTTDKGTSQQEDTRWQKTFRKGRELAVQMIDLCSTVAPVDVLVVAGNHDLQRSFYLGEALNAWYHSSKNVNINNDSIVRKYYGFGKNLIGFAHGHSTKMANLPLLMAMEAPELWASSTHREVHIGHMHNKKDVVYAANEENGVVVRVLRSLVADDAWTFSKGYKSLKAAEGFLWHPENGVVAQFTAQPIIE